MLITAYGRRTDHVAWSGECFGVTGRWGGDDRGDTRSLQRIVVDLGTKADRIGRRAVREDPDVIVLTHDDRDHISGAPAALWSLNPRADRQVWLPADWWYLVAAWASAASRPLDFGRRPTTVDPDQLAHVAEGDGGLPGMVVIDGDVSRPEVSRLQMSTGAAWLTDWLEDLPWERPEGIDPDMIAAGIGKQTSPEGHPWVTNSMEIHSRWRVGS